MNDPLDGQSDLFPDSRQNVFVSSWTSEEKDEIPMWKIYNDLKGIRIRMPIDLFNHSGELIVAKLNDGDNYLIKSKLDKSYLINRKKAEYKTVDSADNAFKINSVYGPTKVDYCESEVSLNDGLVEMKKLADFNSYEINLHLIGQKKIDYWSFEKEFRFRIFYGNAIKFAGSKGVIDKIFKESPIITDFLDVNFKEDSLENIQIIIGPKANADAKEKIERLLTNKKIKQFEIKESRIKFN